MTDQTCAIRGCSKPPVKGSQYCPRHLAEHTQKARNLTGGILGVIAIVTMVILKLIGGRKT